MAYQGSTNNVFTYGSADYCYAIKEALIAAGWQLVASGGGTGGSFSTTVDMVPTLASNVDGTYGRLGWNNSGAWAQLREPLNGANPRREYVFMRGSTVDGMIIKYSRQTGFSGGAAATLPTTGAGTPPPGDGVVVLASSNRGYSTTVNNDAAITTAASGQNIALVGTGYVSCIASDVPVNGVYGFWMISYAAGTGALAAIIMSEGMSASSTPTQDQDPSIRQVAGGSFFSTDSINAVNGVAFWIAYGLPTKAYAIGASGYGGLNSVNSAYNAQGASLIPSATASTLNPYNSKINVYPMLVFPSSATYGYQPKGFTSGLGWFNVTQNQVDTFNLTTTEPRIVIAGRVVMPWKQNVVPLV